jgi:hypothetical protein
MLELPAIFTVRRIVGRWSLEAPAHEPLQREQYCRLLSVGRPAHRSAEGGKLRRHPQFRPKYMALRAFLPPFDEGGSSAM